MHDRNNVEKDIAPSELPANPGTSVSCCHVKKNMFASSSTIIVIYIQKSILLKLP
ncbi:CLEC2D isoform 8 [Pongo abelii]|uniref:CLEC2D isoform 8 n=1 Tax=Pongo abelii TaxID=9601 RepID=A0A2J8TC98_PONAB|nr:CLEC2D isoform 8 [Pongo abelii]